MKHTPTPWEPLDVDQSFLTQKPVRYFIGKDGNCIGEYRCREERDFTVRAVNAYDELVSCAKEARHLLLYMADVMGAECYKENEEEALSMARQLQGAIDKAEAQ